MNDMAWIIACMILAGTAVTYLWRFLAVVAVTRIDAESDVLLWVRAVSTALVAALVMRMVLVPSGVLADVPLAIRLAATAIGLAVFYAAAKNTNLGTFAAVIALTLSYVVLG